MPDNTIVLTVTDQVTVTHAVQTFLKIALQGLSAETKKWYSARLKLLTDYLGPARPLADIFESDLADWRENIESRHLAPDTLHGYIRAARRLFQWLHRRGLITADLTQDFNLPRLPRSGRRGIDDDSAARILLCARLNSPRDYALLLFMATTSARRGGVANLRLEDLNLDAPDPYCRQAHVIEKGQKQRIVIFDGLTLAALKAWLKLRPDGTTYVFTKADGHPLKPHSIGEILERYKVKLSITGRCSPHQWRHRWFRQHISDGLPLAQAAQLGGHESVNITFQFYGQYALDELQTAYDKHHKCA